MRQKETPAFITRESLKKNSSANRMKRVRLLSQYGSHTKTKLQAYRFKAEQKACKVLTKKLKTKSALTAN